ncbi:hypothetical protein GCM10025868_08190 [Angustibacter aerolatus]|uniref:Transport-associated OB type 2 domain-containing protein n=1 Tax=Angustibacter aerolatus TaxID=1162965 RepID=A0ABQ6JDS0_9ACTN|nr:hypothetical protein GCM10025868_08190 [Angustibacter aerolatus]
MRGTVVERSGDVLGVDVAGGRVHVPAGRSPVGEGEVVVGVRPEKVSLLAAGDEPPSGANVVGPGTVVDASFFGVSTQYLVRVPGVGLLTVFSQNTGLGALARRGDEVRLCWDPQHTFGLRGDEDLHAGVDPDLVPGSGSGDAGAVAAPVTPAEVARDATADAERHGEPVDTTGTRA